MSGPENSFRFELPGWVSDWLEHAQSPVDENAAMTLAIELAGENISRDGGGPFAALVVNAASGSVVAAGLNRVMATGLSMAHAEMLALSLAQQKLGDWDLGRSDSLSLISTCEPCAMCYGALPWSGIRRLVFGSGREDAVKAGFDEGEKPEDWQDALRRRGIEVIGGVQRDRANGLFDMYHRAGGHIYNAR